jgi:hypothetical protein
MALFCLPAETGATGNRNVVLRRSFLNSMYRDKLITAILFNSLTRPYPHGSTSVVWGEFLIFKRSIA